MDAIVTALETAITPATMFAVVAGLAGLIGVGILVGFGNTKLSRVVGGLGRGKAKI